MPATTIDVEEAQTQLSRLLTLALQGGDVVIVQNSIPLVRLVPVTPQKRRRVASLHKGAMQMQPDFNDPLPDDLWLGTS